MRQLTEAMSGLGPGELQDVLSRILRKHRGKLLLTA